MKKSVTAVAVLALGFALGACSDDSGSGSGSGSTGAAADTKATIVYSYWDDNQTPALKKNIEDFNKLYPNITVTTTVTPWAQYWTKLSTQASGNELPDVFWMNGPNFQLYASGGKLEPMTASIDAGKIDPKNYPKALNDLYSLDGTQYGIPKDFDTVALWYNKAIFAQAGVDLPTADWTWDDFHSAAKTISDKLKGDGIYGVATGLVGGQEGYYNTIEQAGGFIVSPDGKKSGYDSAESIEGLQFWADLIADGSSPTLEQLSDTKPNIMFTSGKSAMFWSGTWSVAELAKATNAKDLDVIDLPKGPKGQATVIHGLANVVSKDSKNKDAAIAFAQFLGTKEAQQMQAEMGAANPAFTGTQEAFISSAPSFNLKCFIDAGDTYAVPYPVSKSTAKWTDLEAKLLPDAFSGKRPVAEVAKELANGMNDVLASE